MLPFLALCYNAGYKCVRINSVQTDGSLLDFKLIKVHVDKISKETGYTDSMAFLCLVLQKRLQLDEYDIDESIIDGPNDCGIDAIYIDETDVRPKVYLLQSKYFQSDHAYNKNFAASALEKMSGAINDLILNVPRTSSYINIKLKEKLNDIRNLQNPLFIIIFD
jgi:hypothetical protein